MKKSKPRPLGAVLLAQKREMRDLAVRVAEHEKNSERLAGRLHELDLPALTRLDRKLDLLLKIYGPAWSAPTRDDSAKS